VPCAASRKKIGAKNSPAKNFPAKNFSAKNLPAKNPPRASSNPERGGPNLLLVDVPVLLAG
jgi:hypothetical protein